jgi:hypothetical protein
MDYRLHRDGKDEGTFPLEELNRRRQAGELSGTEWVWREGMPDWQSLDSILQASGFAVSNTGSPPIPSHLPTATSTTKSRRLWVWIIALVGAVFLAGVICIGVFALRFVKSVREIASQNDGANAGALASLQVPTNTLTQKDIRKHGKEFRLRQYLEGYKKYGRHDQPCDADAFKLIESWIVLNYGGDQVENLPSPELLADKLAAQPGCDDPLVLTVAAANSNEVHEKIRRLERALAGFQKSSNHKAYPKFFATVTLANEMGSQSQRIPGLDSGAVQHFRAAFSDGSFQPQDEPELADILVTGWGSSFFERKGGELYPIVREAKDYRWLALTLEGQFHIKSAWKARGGGWADTVTTQGWQGFSDHLEKARSALTEAWKLRPDRALAPAQMITVAMGETGATDMRTWFDRAISVQIDHPQAWSHIRWGLRPRWHGNHEAMLALGVAAVKTRRFDTDVPRKFFDFISDVESEMELPSGEHIYGDKNIWPHLQTMYEGYISEPSEAKTKDGWRSTYAAVAYLGGKYDVARKQLEALAWKPKLGNLTGWGKDLSLMPLEVAALTGNASDRITKANEAYVANNLSGAEKIYTEIASSAEADERTRQFIQCRLAAVKQEQLLARGEWIELTPASDNDPNWVFWDGKVRKIADGVEVESGKDGHSFYPRTRVGPSFEVTGSFEVVRSSNKDFQAGLIMGLPDRPSSFWYGFRMKRNQTEGQLVTFARGWGRQQVWKNVPLNDKQNSFQFRMQNDKADIWLNGTKILSQVAPSKKMQLTANCLVGLGAYNDMNDTVIRYHNVKLRWLNPGTSQKAEAP